MPNNPSSMRTPVIGVTSRHGNPEWVRENSQNYLNTLSEYGARAVVLAPDAPIHLPGGASFSPDAEGRLPDALIHHLDGLILSGGGDVDPSYFGQVLNGAIPDHIDRRRDELELSLARAALEADLPLFGICRGCQVLNVAAGGGMVQHFDGHRSPHGQPVYHDVRLRPDTAFRAVIDADVLAVNTYHHQGLDTATLAPLFTAVALAEPDAWLIEAYESANHRWVTGVQWHPERLFELEGGHRRLWQSFLAACRGA